MRMRMLHKQKGIISFYLSSNPTSSSKEEAAKEKLTHANLFFLKK